MFFCACLSGYNRNCATAAEARRFIEDKSFNKRIKLIDKLLESDDYADHFAMKWCDILRVKAEFPVNLWPNAAQAYHHWVRTSLRDNKSYDKFVREMLTSNGSNFRVGPVNFYRACSRVLLKELLRRSP